MGNAQALNSDKIGFQVISVSPQSPGEAAGLKVTEDFILTMNGQSLPFMEAEKIMSTVKVFPSCQNLVRLDFFKTKLRSACLQNSVNRPVLLTVYNVKSGKSRDVVLTPSSSWPGDGLLGIKIKLGIYEAVHIDVNFNDVYSRVSG